MDCIPKNRLLEHRPDTFISIRKEYNLEKPGMMKEAIRILREWIEKQEHFKKKDFTNHYLETVIIACKGSLERSKIQMDRMCTLRTLVPHFFGVHNPKTDFGNLFDAVIPSILPKMTPDHYRIYLVKVNDKIHLIKDYLNYFRFLILIGDYIKAHDYCRGFYILVDFTEANVMDFLTNLNPVYLRQAFSIFIEGYGMRIKGIYIYSSSKVIDTFVTLLKQLTSPKIASRIFSYKHMENLPELVPLEVLPEEYGGKERPLKKILDKWLDILSSKEYLDYIKDLNEAGTNEDCRQSDKFNEEYAGMPGTFRMLTVD